MRLTVRRISACSVLPCVVLPCPLFWNLKPIDGCNTVTEPLRDRDDYFCESSYETFIHDVSRTEEKIHDIRYVPKSEAALQSLLMLEHQLAQQVKRPKRTKSFTKRPDTRCHRLRCQRIASMSFV